MNPYRHAEWVKFRKDVIKLHDGQCAHCGRSHSDGVVLQVHHKIYIAGRMPWKYAHSDCEALCKGCHAEEHGKIMPQSGWIWLATDDLEDVIGNCELCGQDIRYVYAITHPNWGSMAVGTDCCDRLTGTTEAAEYHDRYTKAVDMRKRFVGSKRWRTLDNEDLFIRQKGIDVSIRSSGQKFIIVLDGVTGKAEYDTIIDAKIKALDFIASGEAALYLARRRLNKAEKSRHDALHRWQLSSAEIIENFKRPINYFRS